MTTSGSQVPGPEFAPAENADEWFTHWQSLGTLGSLTDHVVTESK